MAALPSISQPAWRRRGVGLVPGNNWATYVTCLRHCRLGQGVGGVSVGNSPFVTFTCWPPVSEVSGSWWSVSGRCVRNTLPMTFTLWAVVLHCDQSSTGDCGH